MGNILSRIQEITLNEGITIGALERKIGTSKGVLSRAINNGTDIQSKWIEVLVDNYPQYSTRWLLTGRGSMLRTEQTQPVPQPVAQSTVQDSSSGEAAIYYKMYKEEKAEKESKIEEIGALKLKISQLESNKLATPKAKIDTQSKEPKASREVEPKAPEHPPLAFDGGFIESFTSEPSGGSAKDSIPMRSPTASLKKSSASKT